MPKEKPRGDSAEKPKEKPDTKPDEKPEGEPDTKPVEVKTPVSPTTGESEDKEWRKSVTRKLDSLTAKVEAQGKAIQEWGFGDPGKESKPDDTSDRAEKAKSEPLDEWSR